MTRGQGIFLGAVVIAAGVGGYFLYRAFSTPQPKIDDGTKTPENKGKGAPAPDHIVVVKPTDPVSSSVIGRKAYANSDATIWKKDGMFYRKAAKGEFVGIISGEAIIGSGTSAYALTGGAYKIQKGAVSLGASAFNGSELEYTAKKVVGE